VCGGGGIYARGLSVEVAVVELRVDETEDEYIKSLTERLTAWIELIKLAL